MSDDTRWEDPRDTFGGQVSAKDYFRPQEPGPFDYLEWLVQDLSFGSLPETIRAVNAKVRAHGRQGATDQELRDAMAMCVVEEAGEFIGEYRRLRGFARRAGNREQMLSELADVVISALMAFDTFGADAHAAIQVKLAKIISRGYVNKENQNG
jgi:NTP pyrophosphatase (non-canonical NTP hydrolase)